MTDGDGADPHRPTVAGPEPVGTEPTPAAPPSDDPAGTAAFAAEGSDGGGFDVSDAQAKIAEVQAKVTEIGEERPEALVGAALAGGFVAAMILKRITGGGRR